MMLTAKNGGRLQGCGPVDFFLNTKGFDMNVWDRTTPHFQSMGDLIADCQDDCDRNSSYRRKFEAAVERSRQQKRNAWFDRCLIVLMVLCVVVYGCGVRFAIS
jgi:hypothetical protein